MTAQRKHVLVVTLLLGLAAMVFVPLRLFQQKYIRVVVVRDLSMSSTQEVSVAFHPSNMRWGLSGHLQGTGTLIVPYVFSNRVSGWFSTNGAGDYYDTNVAVIFLPEGPVKGTIRGSFFVNDFF